MLLCMLPVLKYRTPSGTRDAALQRRAKVQPKRADHTVSLQAAATSDHKSLERQKSCFGLWRHSSLAQLVEVRSCMLQY